MPTLMNFMLPDPDTVSSLRAMHSLREKHVRTLTEALSRLPGTWSLECHESYDGDLTLMLMPQHQERASLVVSREADGFHLIANQDDDYRKLGCFGAMDELVATMRSSAVAAMKREPVGRHI